MVNLFFFFYATEVVLKKETCKCTSLHRMYVCLYPDLSVYYILKKILCKYLLGKSNYFIYYCIKITLNFMNRKVKFSYLAYSADGKLLCRL